MACSLCVVGFGESIVDLFAISNDVIITRVIAVGVLVILVGLSLLTYLFTYLITALFFDRG